jgi:hypothetical protein
VITGQCHCGGFTFRIDGDLPDAVVRCTCSFCAKRGALVAYYPPAQFHPVAAAGIDGIYRWNTQLVAHHFCNTCGMAIHSDSPAFDKDGGWDQVTRRIGVNARLFDDFDADAVPVTVIDGKNLW